MNIFARINERFAERMKLLSQGDELRRANAELRKDNADLAMKEARWRDRCNAMAAHAKAMRERYGNGSPVVLHADPNPALQAECAELSRQLQDAERKLRDAERRIAELIKVGMDELLYRSKQPGGAPETDYVSILKAGESVAEHWAEEERQRLSIYLDKTPAGRP